MVPQSDFHRDECLAELDDFRFSLAISLAGTKKSNIHVRRSNGCISACERHYSRTGCCVGKCCHYSTVQQLKDAVKILGGIGRGNSYFDPFAFAPVTEARFGNGGFNILEGPGIAQWDLGIFRRFDIAHRNVQFRAEVFNVTNRPQFSNPGANRSSLQLNPDGTIRNLNGYTEVTSTRGRFSERQLRLGLRIGF